MRSVNEDSTRGAGRQTTCERCVVHSGKLRSRSIFLSVAASSHVHSTLPISPARLAAAWRRILPSLHVLCARHSLHRAPHSFTLRVTLGLWTKLGM